MSSVAYWYAAAPTRVAAPPSVEQRRPVRRDVQGRWLVDPETQTTSRTVELNDEMRAMKDLWKQNHS